MLIYHFYFFIFIKLSKEYQNGKFVLSLSLQNPISKLTLNSKYNLPVKFFYNDHRNNQENPCQSEIYKIIHNLDMYI